jgi:hypothetical protein
MNKLFLKKNKGFTILFAVIVSSLVLAIGLSIANITLKQIKISSLGRESQIAFYAADSASECILFNDLMGNHVFASSSNDGTASGIINCYGANSQDGSNKISIAPLTQSGPSDATTTVSINTINNGVNLCATVDIGKHDTNSDGYSDKTIILSRGYNKCGPGASNLLERGIRIRY